MVSLPPTSYPRGGVAAPAGVVAGPAPGLRERRKTQVRSTMDTRTCVFRLSCNPPARSAGSDPPRSIRPPDPRDPRGSAAALRGSEGGSAVADQRDDRTVAALAVFDGSLSETIVTVILPAPPAR